MKSFVDDIIHCSLFFYLIMAVLSYFTWPIHFVLSSPVKYAPGQKFTSPQFLILCCFLHDQRLMLCSSYILWFSRIFCILDSFLTDAIWFCNPSLVNKNNRGTRAQLIQQDKMFIDAHNVYWCSRRQHNPLSARDVKILNRMIVYLYIIHIFISIS